MAESGVTDGWTLLTLVLLAGVTVLGTIIVGMAVYLPLRLGLGWGL
jgi:hypothetical protein